MSNNISINEILSKDGHLLIFDSEKLHNNLFLIKYLPLLSKHFAKTYIYSGKFMLNFWIKICSFFPNIKILPLTDFTKDFSHFGVIINLDEMHNNFSEHYHKFLVMNIHKEENFNILEDNELNSNCDKLNKLCKLLNLDISLLDDSLVLQMINHFYPFESKNHQKVFLIDNLINKYLLQLILKKKQIQHVIISPLSKHDKHKNKDSYDLDTILIILKNAEVFYTDNEVYYEFISHPLLNINLKQFKSALSFLF